MYADVKTSYHEQVRDEFLHAIHGIKEGTRPPSVQTLMYMMLYWCSMMENASATAEVEQEVYCEAVQAIRYIYPDAPDLERVNWTPLQYTDSVLRRRMNRKTGDLATRLLRQLNIEEN